MPLFISNFKNFIPKEIRKAATYVAVALIIICATSLYLDPFDSRLSKRRTNFDRTQIQEKNYVLWDMLQIRRAIRDLKNEKVDILILGDSRSRQIAGGMYADRVIKIGEYLALDASVIGTTYFEYIRLYDSLKDHLKPAGWVFVQVSMHSLGQPDIGYVNAIWEQSFGPRYLVSFPTLVGNLDLLKLKHGPKSQPQAATLPSTPASQVNPAQQLQNDRISTMNISLAKSQLTYNFAWENRAENGHNILFIHYPQHESLLNFIRAESKYSQFYNLFHQNLNGTPHWIDFEKEPCKILFHDGIHYQAPTAACFQELLRRKANSLISGEK